MNISLPREIERLVHDKVKSGLYPTASEVIRDGLRLLEERDRLYQGRLQDLRVEVRKGLDQLDRGEGIPLDPTAFKRRLRQATAQRKRTRRG
jgi:antitoxin ParD1/3/4